MWFPSVMKGQSIAAVEYHSRCPSNATRTWTPPKQWRQSMTSTLGRILPRILPDFPTHLISSSAVFARCDGYCGSASYSSSASKRHSCSGSVIILVFGYGEHKDKLSHAVSNYERGGGERDECDCYLHVTPTEE